MFSVTLTCFCKGVIWLRLVGGFLMNVAGVNIHLRHGFTAGEWILQNFKSGLGNQRDKALIAAASCAWFYLGCKVSSQR